MISQVRASTNVVSEIPGERDLQGLQLSEAPMRNVYISMLSDFVMTKAPGNKVEVGSDMILHSDLGSLFLTDLRLRVLPSRQLEPLREHIPDLIPCFIHTLR